MRKLKIFTSSVLLATTPTMLVYPQDVLSRAAFQTQKVHYEEKSTQTDYTSSYDDMLRLLDEIESGELEKKCTPEELEKLKHFVAHLAKKGALPDNSEESLSLDEDIEELLNGENNFYENAFATSDEYQYMIIPVVLNRQRDVVLCKSWASKRWHYTKNFVKKHKKALIIGAAIAVAAAVVVVAIAASSAAAASAAGAAGVAASSGSKSDKKDQNEASSSVPADVPPATPTTNEASTPKPAIDNQIPAFKENIVQNQFFQPINPAAQNQGLSWEENGRELGSLLAHDSFNKFQHQIPYNSGLAQYTSPVPGQSAMIGHSEIDQKFSTDYGYLYSTPGHETNFNTLSHQVRGEKALAFGYYNQAVQDLGNAIETNPTNPIPYLERGIAHFNLGQYDRSVEDYKQFVSQTQKANPMSVSKFSLGFAKGLPKGVYESGEDFLLFMNDFVKHPIQTSSQIVDSITTLVDLVRKDEWGVVAEALTPEVYQLVTQWDDLSSDTRGELAGYALGKHGADILVPGALAKVASKSVKSAQELANVCKNLQIAQETLVLETAAGLGNSAKIAEVVRAGQTATFLGEELGFTAQEMGQLKKAGRLEGALNDALENLATKSPTEAYSIAKNGGKHAPLITEFGGKSVKEIQKSIRSYEKLIVEHKDKIANPSKYCPDWDKMDPRHKKSLVEVKWPAEIQCYTEQRDVLQSMLDLKQ